ncbi:hypothetical protein PMIN04_010059 [Paraphaeosphaeria minitans]
MAVQDPNFWKRFSIAVHQDDAAKQELAEHAELKHSDSWLEGQRRKRRHRAWVCWTFWICLLLLVGGAVTAVLVLKSKGIIKT